MAQLNVGIGADVSRFVAGMNTMSTAARRASASIKSSMDATLGVGGSTASASGTRAAAAAAERLTKARVAQEAATRRIAAAEARLIEVTRGKVASEAAQLRATDRLTSARSKLQRIDRDAANEKLLISQKEADAARAVGIAESRAADFKTSSAKTSAAQLGVENALAEAQARHGRIQRDVSNEILKAAEKEKSQLDRVTIAEKELARVKDKTSISGLRRARALKDAEDAAYQAIRDRSHVAAEQATVL
jgi:hypothetical protein